MKASFDGGVIDWMAWIYGDDNVKKMVFGIAMILFGFSMAYISVQARWPMMQTASILFIFIGLGFAIFGFFEKGPPDP